MSSHGEVKVWYMSEVERLEYIEKHPIIPTKKPKGVELVKVTEMQRKRANETKIKNLGNRVIDKIDRLELHKRFTAGDKLVDIAEYFDITLANLNNVIKQYRKTEPDKWPLRPKRGKQKNK